MINKLEKSSSIRLIHTEWNVSNEIGKQFLFRRSWREQEQKFTKRTESEKKANLEGSAYLNNEVKRVKRVQKCLWWSWLDGKENGGRNSQHSKQAKSKSKMLSTSTTGQKRMKTVVWWVTDFIQKNSTLTQESSLKENAKMSEPFQTRQWKFTLLPAFQRSKFKWKKRLATVTNAWRVRNSKAVQHVVGKQCTVHKLHGFSWRPTCGYSCQRLGCYRLWRCLVHRLDKFSKLMNSRDGQVEVSFMTKGKGKATTSSFKWPTRKDVFKWFERKSILCASYWGSRSCR